MHANIFDLSSDWNKFCNRKYHYFSFETTPNSLNLKIDGVKKGDIQSPVLSKAFSGVYLDKNAVSPSLRESIAKTVLSWL